MRTRNPDPRTVCGKTIHLENTADNSDGGGDDDDHNHDETDNKN